MFDLFHLSKVLLNSSSRVCKILPWDQRARHEHTAEGCLHQRA